MVSSNQSDSLRIPHFQSEKQEEGLHTVVASVHKVPHEEIVGFWALPSHLEELHQVIELAVNVSADLNSY